MSSEESFQSGSLDYSASLDLRRSSHNEMERKRRMQQKVKINDLKEVIPSLAGRKASTVMIVNKAREYILTLESKLKDMSTHVYASLKNSGIHSANGNLNNLTPTSAALSTAGCMLPAARPLSRPGGAQACNGLAQKAFHSSFENSGLTLEVNSGNFNGNSTQLGVPNTKAGLPCLSPITKQPEHTAVDRKQYQKPYKHDLQLPPLHFIEMNERKYQEPSPNMLYKLSEVADLHNSESPINSAKSNGHFLRTCSGCKHPMYDNEPSIFCNFCGPYCHQNCVSLLDGSSRVYQYNGQIACRFCLDQKRFYPSPNTKECHLE